MIILNLVSWLVDYICNLIVCINYCMMDFYLYGEVMVGLDDDVVNVWLKIIFFLDDCINKNK